MHENDFEAACRVLGISPDADRTAVDRAFAERKILYADESLATYALLSDAERQEQLDRLEAAHRRAVEYLERQATPPRPSAEAEPASSERTPPADDGATAEPAPPPKPPSPAERSTPPPFEAGESPGAYLRRCREGHDLELAALAEETRISARHLSNLEQDTFGDLQAEVYVRGFVTTYARALKISPVEPVVAAFLDLHRATRDA